MFSTLCLIITSAILFFILKYRVHVHVTYTPTSSRVTARKGRRAEEATGTDARTRHGPALPQAMTRPAKDPGSIVWGDITSALVNLGAPKAKAQAAAQKAVRQFPDSFDDQLRAAIQEVAA